MEDILPTEEAYTDASIETGTVSLSGTQSQNAAPPAAAKGDAGSKPSTAAANTSVSAEYVSNLTQMLIDS